MKRKYLPLLIGSLPHTDPKDAVEAVFQYFPDSPSWPQFPRISPLEGMELQFLENIPGWYIDNNKVIFKRGDSAFEEISNFLQLAINDDYERFEITSNRAIGLKIFLEKLKCINKKPEVVKGQVIGPITFLTSHKIEDGSRLFKDETYLEVIPLFLRQKALYQYYKFKEVVDSDVIIFFDEPILSEIGSAVTNITTDVAEEALEKVLDKLPFKRGIHICGNSDWDFILSLPIDIVNFDAFKFSKEFLIYYKAIKEFINKNGIIALGVIPTNIEDLKRIGFNEIYNLTMGIVEKLKEICDKKDLEENLIITPSCGMGALDIESAEKVFKLLKELTMKL